MARRAGRALTYREAGVDAPREAAAVRSAIGLLNATFSRAAGTGAVRLPNGFYAAVLEFAGQGLAISTDGVGSKVLVAQALGEYRSIGIDCVAMNVNDVLCVGATPLALVDYVAVNRLDERFMAGVVEGLVEGARDAAIAIPSGETAQLPGLLRAPRGQVAFDLVGTCVGVVALDAIITGSAIAPGDVVLGLGSSGIHSNGLTLARRVLHDRAGYGYESHVDELGCTLGEELLRPTRIYVRPVLAMLAEGLAVRGLAHITGDGFENLTRLTTRLGFVLDDLPPPPPVFELIRRVGGIPPAEMMRTFNMGVGFCVVLDPRDATRAAKLAESCGHAARVVGRVAEDAALAHRVRIEPAGVTLGADEPPPGGPGPSGRRPARRSGARSGAGAATDGRGPAGGGGRR